MRLMTTLKFTKFGTVRSKLRENTWEWLTRAIITNRSEKEVAVRLNSGIELAILTSGFLFLKVHKDGGVA